MPRDPNLKAVFAAIRKGDILALKETFRVGIDLNAREELHARTPLFSAIHHRCLEIIRVLVDSGASVNVRDSSGATPLHVVAYTGDRDVAQILLEAGANPTVKTTDEFSRYPKEDPYPVGATPLDIAVRERNQDVHVLLAAGAG